MDIKNKLQSVYEVNKKIKCLKEEYKYYNEISKSVQGIRYDTENTNPNKRTQAPFIKFIEKADDTKYQIKQLEEELHKNIIEIEEIISSIDNHEDRMILRYRHIYFMSWDEIAKKIGYSIRHTMRKYEKVIEKLNLSYDVI